MATKKFKDFGIEPTAKSFVGEKIKIAKVLNREITVSDFTIDNSQFKDKYLRMQISVGDNKHVLFTGSAVLMEMIQKVPLVNFPFTTTIVEDNERYVFT